MNKNFKKIQGLIARDPLSKNFFSFVVFIFFGCGFALAVAATYIEVDFFSSIFNLQSGLFAIIILSFINLLKITSHFLTRYISKDERFASVSRGMFYIFRTVLILFSIVACFSVVAEYMNNPHLEKELDKATKELKSQYETEYSLYDEYVRRAADSLERESKNQVRGVVKGPKWKADSTRVEMYQQKITALNNGFFTAKAAIEDSVRASDEIKNQTFISVVDLIQKMGFRPNKDKTYAIYVILVAVLFTLILELGMWFVFEYLGSIYYRNMRAKMDTREEISEQIEKTKLNIIKEDLNTLEEVEEIGRKAHKASNGLSNFNDVIETNQ